MSFCIFCTSCAFKPRSKAQTPIQLHQVYLSYEKPHSPFATQFTELLKSVGAMPVMLQSQAPFSIITTKDKFTYAQPPVVNASLPSSINYTQEINLEIQNNRNQKIIASGNFSTSQSITLNANQIYTSNSDEFMIHELNREMSLQAYYWIVSKNIKNKLNHANTQ